MPLLRRKLNVLFMLLIAAVAVYGVIKGWMYYNAQQAMEELSVATAGRAEITYDGIDTELRGAVTVRGLNLLVSGAPQPLRVDAVRVSGPDLPYFLWGKDGQQAPPDRMRVDVQGIRIDLDDELFDALQEGMPIAGDGGQRGCGPADELDPALLRELGFSELLMDATLSYVYDPGSERLDADMQFSVDQMQKLQASVSLTGVPADAMQGGMATIPSLAGMDVRVRIEPEFARRYVGACAAQRDQSLDDYREALINQTLADLSRAGMQLGAGLTQAVRDFHQTWGEFQVSANPEQPVNLMGLLFSSPDNWQQQLGIEVALNQRPLMDLSFKFRPPDAEELAVMLGQEPPPSAPRKPQPRYHYVYKPTPLSALDGHIGNEVRLYLRDDQPMRAGILVGIAGGELRVEQRLHGGKITAHVAIDDVARAETRHVEQITADK
jgi:hypothetical protein